MATCSTGLPWEWAIKPTTEKMTKPAKKLVQELTQQTMRASLKASRNEEFHTVSFFPVFLSLSLSLSGKLTVIYCCVRKFWEKVDPSMLWGERKGGGEPTCKRCYCICCKSREQSKFLDRDHMRRKSVLRHPPKLGTLPIWKVMVGDSM